MQVETHWEEVYRTKQVTEVSWFQERAERSLRLIQESGVPLTASIIDVGGGASVLVDDLLERGYRDITVLDVSASALELARERLGERAGAVRWLQADITTADLPAQAFDLWHDRAVFHFLTSHEAQAAYLARVRHTLTPGGHLIVATFADDGPERCSGLPVQRYSESELRDVFGEGFELVGCEREEHPTPAGKVQSFVFCHFRHHAKEGG